MLNKMFVTNVLYRLSRNRSHILLEINVQASHERLISLNLPFRPVKNEDIIQFLLGLVPKYRC